jgi:hypothetical protein
MVTQTKPIDSEIEETETVSAVEGMLSGIRFITSSAERQDNLATKFARLLVAFYDRLSEPAMTKRDRLRRDISDDHNEMYLLWR